MSSHAAANDDDDDVILEIVEYEPPIYPRRYSKDLYRCLS